MNNTYRYPMQNLLPDYVRSVSGLIICLLPVVITLGEGDGISGALLLFPVLATLFLIYFANTVLKQMSIVVIDDQGVSILGLTSRTICWDDLSQFKLSYFSTWRSGENGWMQLRLNSPTRALRLSSSLIGFEEIIRFSVRSVDLNKMELDEATLKNLNGLDNTRPLAESEVAPA